MKDMNNVYIHIPFCSSICGYCDFSRVLKEQSVEDDYIEKITDDISKHKGIIKTLFIGGGTPSCLSEENLCKLFRTLKELSYSKDYEATIECNPKDINESFIHKIKNSIINRVSIGVQSFDNNELKYLERTHSSEQAIEAIKMIQSVVDNVSIDIMYGFKDHNLKSINKTLKIIKDLKLKHASFYNLIIKPGSKFYNESNIEDEKVMDKINSIKFLKNYEIANYSIEGFECKHNLAIWNYEDFIAYGFGGHSKIDNNLYSNNGDAISWNTELIEEVNEEESFKNEIILGLRLSDGIDQDREVIKYFSKVISDNKKYFETNNNKVKVKKEYQDRLNEVLLLFV